MLNAITEAARKERDAITAEVALVLAAVTEARVKYMAASHSACDLREKAAEIESNALIALSKALQDAEKAMAQLGDRLAAE